MQISASPLARALAWLGRQGTRAVAAIVVAGIALPPLGALLKPHLTAAVFVLLCIAFTRVDMAALKDCLRRPAMVLAATAWTALVMPGLFGLVCLASGLKQRSPDLFVAIMLQAIASPLMAAPALAALMGLDATLVLVTLVASTALIPLTAPLFAHLLIGPGGLAISPLALGGKLLAILLGACLVAVVVRRLAGLAAIARRRDEINGLNVVVLFVFVAAVMEGVAARFMAAPWLTLGVALLAFAVFFAVLGLTVAVFLPAGRPHALAIGFMASQRNMGLMLAATGGALPELTWLYFALSQLPIYLSPQLLRPLARRLLARTPRGAAQPAREQG